jgi:carboxymethylenebutenolidase
MKAFRFSHLVIVLLLGALAVQLSAQQPVTFPSGGSTAQGILYLPQGAGPHPAVILIHEWWGLNDWIKQQAAGYAAKGYVALAVDLYRGQVADNPDLAHELMRGLPQD